MRTPAKTKEERGQFWEDNLLFCINHPKLRCIKSTYVHSRRRHCTYCHARSAQKRRENQYDTTEVLCKFCPKKCTRTYFVKRGNRICALCYKTRHPSYKKYKRSVQGREQSNARRRSLSLYRRIQENRL